MLLFLVCCFLGCYLMSFINVLFIYFSRLTGNRDCVFITSCLYQHALSDQLVVSQLFISIFIVDGNQSQVFSELIRWVFSLPAATNQLFSKIIISICIANSNQSQVFSELIRWVYQMSFIVNGNQSIKSSFITLLSSYNQCHNVSSKKGTREDTGVTEFLLPKSNLDVHVVESGQHPVGRTEVLGGNEAIARE